MLEFRYEKAGGQELEKLTQAASTLEAKKITMTVIIVSAFLVLFSVVANNYFAPDKVAMRVLEKISRDYYENYYYDKFIAVNGATERQKIMDEFKESGFAPVLLRHLLLFDNERNKKYAGFFETSSYACDKNSTSIKIIPVEPFGKKDYEISYSLSCNYK